MLWKKGLLAVFKNSGIHCRPLRRGAVWRSSETRDGYQLDGAGEDPGLSYERFEEELFVFLERMD